MKVVVHRSLRISQVYMMLGNKVRVYFIVAMIAVLLKKIIYHAYIIKSNITAKAKAYGHYEVNSLLSLQELFIIKVLMNIINTHKFKNRKRLITESLPNR